MNSSNVIRWRWRILLVTVVVVSIATVNRPRSGQASGPLRDSAKQDTTRNRLQDQDADSERSGPLRARPTSSVRSQAPARPSPATDIGTAAEAGIALCAQTANCQAPDDVDAKKSNRVEFNVADDFRPSASANVTEACWWGTYGDDASGSLVDCHNANVVDTFEITYCTDAGGFPGTTCTTFSQSLGTLTVTGPTATGGLIAGALSEFVFTATHAAFPVTAGQCYWIEITNDSGACTWFWEVSLEGGDWAMLDGDPGVPPDGFSLAEFVLLDFAFCLDVALDPTSPCGPPSNDACPSSQPCCEGGPVAAFGCDDDLCCRRVCACDPDCCNPAVGWDVLCATTGFIDGCGAELLCVSECSPCGGPNTGDCCTDTGSPSCNDATCCDAVCAVDPFCCEGTWDAICAGEAETICPALCAPTPACGNPETEDCCTANPFVAGCLDAACCEAVCACDPSCCSPNPGWDAFCATTGFSNSGCGAELLCPDLCLCSFLCGDLNGGEASVNGPGSNADLLDYALFANCFGLTPNGTNQCLCADLNGDDLINEIDFALLVALFETSSLIGPPDCAAP